jgi:hypothetical protein
MPESPKRLHRITCVVHQHMHAQAVDLLSSIGSGPILIESGRSVRRERRRRPLKLPGLLLRLGDSPINLYQFNVQIADSEAVVQRLMHELELDQPGRGTIYAQEVSEYCDGAALSLAAADRELSADQGSVARSLLLRELALITCILSTGGSGEELAASALELGTGVPMVTIGSGTGMRDRLGLLRITVPPEKELVHLLVPALDAEGIMRLLIEEGRLNRPGKGFLYCSPVMYGRLDTSLQIGFQEHPASIEQIIAAIDELKTNTAWRRRFPGLDADASFLIRHGGCEITFVCPDERAGDYIDAAMKAGAGGATVARIRQLKIGDFLGGARERCILTIPEAAAETVVESLLQFDTSQKEPLTFLHSQPAPHHFSYQG